MYYSPQFQLQIGQILENNQMIHSINTESRFQGYYSGFKFEWNNIENIHIDFSSMNLLSKSFKTVKYDLKPSLPFTSGFSLFVSEATKFFHKLAQLEFLQTP